MSENKDKIETEKDESIPITEVVTEDSISSEAAVDAGEVASETGCSESDWTTKYNDLNDKYLRLYSEFDNYRKRTLKEKSDWNKLAGEDIFKAILPVIDDFERAIRSMETTADIAAVKEGISLIYNKLKQNTASKGLEAVESIGQTFDADLHEALANIPATSEELKGKVVDEIVKCYKLNGKVIRWAKVVVGN